MYLIMNYMHIYIERERNLYICREGEKVKAQQWLQGQGARKW